MQFTSEINFVCDFFKKTVGIFRFIKEGLRVGFCIGRSRGYRIIIMNMGKDILRLLIIIDNVSKSK